MISLRRYEVGRMIHLRPSVNYEARLHGDLAGIPISAERYYSTLKTKQFQRVNVGRIPSLLLIVDARATDRAVDRRRIRASDSENLTGDFHPWRQKV